MSTTLAPTPAARTTSRAPWWRRPWLWIAALAIVAGLGGIASILTSGSEELPIPLENGDFETGDLTGWTEQSFVTGSFGGWFVYEDGLTPPTDHDRRLEYNVFQISDPPQGRFAAVTDGNGSGFRILYQDFEVNTPSVLRLTVFYWTEFSPFGLDRETRIIAPDDLTTGVPNQQYRIDLVDPQALTVSVAAEDVLTTVFRTVEGDPVSLEPTEVSLDLSPFEGQTVRLRLAQVDNKGRFFAGVDDVHIEPKR